MVADETDWRKRTSARMSLENIDLPTNEHADKKPLYVRIVLAESSRGSLHTTEALAE